MSLLNTTKECLKCLDKEELVEIQSFIELLLEFHVED